MSLFLLLLACVEPGPAVSPAAPEVIDPSVTEPIPDSEAPSAERATRSGQMAIGSDGIFWVTDDIGGAVLGFDGGDRPASRLALQGEPTRLVRSGSTLWVTLRGSGELAELAEEGDGLRLARRVAVGAEPYDVVVDEGSVYVSLSQEGAVVELDRSDLREVRRFSLGGEPRAMALAEDPWTDAPLLAVMVERTAHLAVVNLDDGETAIHELPPARRSDTPGCDIGDMEARVSGEVVWDDFADRLWLTGMYVDTQLPEPIDPSEVTGLFGGAGDPCRSQDQAIAYYASLPGGTGISRFNPVVYVVDLLSDTQLPPQLLRGGPRGYPTTLELTGTANGSLWVGIESDELVVRVPTSDLTPAVTSVDFAQLLVLFSSTELGAPSSARAVDPSDPRAEPALWSRVRRMFRDGGAVGYAPTDGVDPLVQRGREAFMLATNPTFSGVGAGVACGSCHRDGRDDGLTWLFPDMDRQTPSLAGPVSQTAPLTWIGGVETVAEEATLTSTLRMGGSGPSAEELAAVTAFVDSARRPVARRPTASEQTARALGAEVFHRPEVGCADCHSDANGAGEGVVPLLGIPALSIPPLVGVSATAPYLHDGSAATLEDVVERCREGVMGDTSSLSAAEADALVAYLRWFGEP